MEFLVEIAVSSDIPEGRRDELIALERQRGRELVDAGTIARIWRVPGRWANVGIWNAEDATELHDAISSLPLFPWMSVKVAPLATHYLEQTQPEGGTA
jgi:muconolactone delta-isomerase